MAGWACASRGKMIPGEVVPSHQKHVEKSIEHAQIEGKRVTSDILISLNDIQP